MIDPVTRAAMAAFARKEAAPEAGPEFVVTLVEDDFDPKTLTASPKKILKTLGTLGWDVLQLRHTVTRHNAVLMMSDGKGGLKGDVKTPERDVDHVFLVAADKTRQIYFDASWLNGKFEDAVAHDPVGFLMELYADYKPSVERKKTLGAEEAIIRGEHQDADYNDGTSYIAKTRHIGKATELTVWLADWVALTTKKKEGLNED